LSSSLSIFMDDCCDFFFSNHLQEIEE